MIVGAVVPSVSPAGSAGSTEYVNDCVGVVSPPAAAGRVAATETRLRYCCAGPAATANAGFRSSVTTMVKGSMAASPSTSVAVSV